MSFGSCQDYQYVDEIFVNCERFISSWSVRSFVYSQNLQLIFRTELFSSFKEKANRIDRWRSLSRWSYTLGWWARHWRRTSISTIVIYYLRILNSVRIDEGPLYISICTFFFQENEYYCKFIEVRSFSVSGKLIYSTSFWPFSSNNIGSSSLSSMNLLIKAIHNRSLMIWNMLTHSLLSWSLRSW